MKNKKEEKQQPKGIVALRRNPNQIDGKAIDYTSVMVKADGFTDEEFKEVEALGLNYRKTVDERSLHSSNLPKDGISAAVDYMKEKCGNNCYQTRSMSRNVFYIKFFSIFGAIVAGIVIYVLI